MKKLIFAGLATVLLVLLSLSSLAYAHPGGRDAYGGHYDHKAEGAMPYHVHEGPLEGRRYKNQENMLKVLQKTPGGPEIIKKADQGKK